MDYKFIIEEKLRNEITNKLENEFNNNISKIVRVESDKISEQFKKDLDIYRDIYNIDLHEFTLFDGFIKFCKCSTCTEVLATHKRCPQHSGLDAWIDWTFWGQAKINFNPLINEYILFCSILSWCGNGPVDNQMSITNKGRIYTRHGNGKHIGQASMTGREIPLSKEYFELLKLFLHDGFRTTTGYNVKIVNGFIDIYTKYNPRAKELLIIEEKEKKYEQLINKLNKKENELLDIENKIKEREKQISYEHEKINKSHECIKIKYKNLFERENQIKLNESVYSSCIKLKEIALKLDSLINISDIDNVMTDSEPDNYSTIQTQVNVILDTLNHLID